MTRQGRKTDHVRAALVALGILVLLAPALASAEVLYVASTDVLVIDSASGAKLGSIDVGQFVFDIQFTRDGTRAYLATAGGVIEVDATRHAVRERLTATPAFRLSLAAGDRQLYILGNQVRRLANGRQEPLPSEITVYDLVARRVTRSQPVGMRAEECVVLGDDVVVSQPSAFQLRQISTTDGSAVRATPLRHQAPGDPQPGFLYGLALSADGERIYVAQAAASEPVIHVVDRQSGATRELPFAHGEAFVTGLVAAPDGGELLVSTRNHLAVLDAASGAERAWIALGGAHYGMALGGDGRHSYHTLAAYDEQGGAVTVVDLAAGRVERTIPVAGMSPAAIAVQPR